MHIPKHASRERWVIIQANLTSLYPVVDYFIKTSEKNILSFELTLTIGTAAFLFTDVRNNLD